MYQYSKSVQAHSAAHFWGTDYTGIIKACAIKGTFLLVWENWGVCIRNISGCQVCIIAIVLYRKLGCCTQRTTEPLLGGRIWWGRSPHPLHNEWQLHERACGDQKAERKSRTVRQDQASCTSPVKTCGTIRSWCGGVCLSIRKMGEVKLRCRKIRYS